MSLFLTKPVKEAIGKLAAVGITAKPIRFAKGGHVKLEISDGTATAQYIVASSPSSRHAHLAMITNARRVLREAR